MLNKPMQIVVDKEALISVNIDKLCNLAKKHYLLASDTLLYECATTTQSNRENMLHRYKRIIEAGAYYCSCSIGHVQYESNNCHPYPWFLPDLNVTKDIRSKKSRVEDLLDSTTIEQVFQSRLQVAHGIFLELSKKLKITLDTKNHEVGKAMKDLPSNPFERFQRLTERIDQNNLHQMGVKPVPQDWIKDENRFCLSSEWIIWQFIRLTSIIVQNYYYLRQMGGLPGDKRTEHDYQDMEYVLLLSRAYGILTNDQSLIKPLARAAFPDKQVFSSIEEIPSN
jgi:hypothetical protein